MTTNISTQVNPSAARLENPHIRLEASAFISEPRST
jgi:hypothetical protein